MLSYRNLVWMDECDALESPTPPSRPITGQEGLAVPRICSAPPFADHSQPMGQGGSPPNQRARDADPFPPVGGPGCPRRPGADRWREHEDTRHAGKWQGATAAEMADMLRLAGGFRRRSLQFFDGGSSPASWPTSRPETLSSQALRTRRWSQCDASQCSLSALRFQHLLPMEHRLFCAYT